MKNPEIYNTWTKFINEQEYIDYFKTNEELWYENFNKLKKFIYKNKKLPVPDSENISEKIIGSWLGHQKKNYKNKKKIMKNSEIYNTWTEFINYPEYIEYFKTAEEKWYSNLNKLKTYLDNNIYPNKRSKEINEKKIGSWLCTQKMNYKNKKKIMKVNNKIYNSWTEFISNPKYIDYFTPLQI